MRVLALLVLVACGGSDAIEPLDPRDPTATSGARLVAERWISADGTATFARWYDRELDIHCAFERADGRFRCVPTAARIGAQFGAGRFLDPGCSVPAVVASSQCEAVPFATAATGEVFRVTGPPTSDIFVTGSDLPCTAFTDPDHDYYAIGEPVSIDTFVGGDAVAAGTDLVTQEVRGDDGSRQVVTLESTDPQLGAVSASVDLPCALRLTGPRSAECTAVESRAEAAHPHYSDQACTQRVISPQGFGDRINIHYKAQPCLPRPLYQLGEFRTVPNVFYRDATGACAALDIIGTMVFDVAEIAGANVALALEVDDTATTRLRHTTWVASNGDRWPGPLFDVDLDTPCIPQPDAIDRGHCAPVLNAPFVDALQGSTSATCDPTTNVAMACWGQTMRTRAISGSACGYDLVEYEQATGAITTLDYTGEFAGECGPIDATGLELREGGYSVVAPAVLVEMQLQRDR